MTLCDFSGSLSPNILPKAEGMICHDRPYLSLSQPHLLFCPPAESCSHNSSTSSCVSQFTKNDMAGEKVNCGPPFNAMNCSPSSSNSRSEEHTSELQSLRHLVCRLLLEKKKRPVQESRTLTDE